MSDSLKISSSKNIKLNFDNTVVQSFQKNDTINCVFDADNLQHIFSFDDKTKPLQQKSQKQIKNSIKINNPTPAEPQKTSKKPKQYPAVKRSAAEEMKLLQRAMFRRRPIA